MTFSFLTAMKKGLFINRNFALLWGGAAVSSLGDVLFTTTLVLVIAESIARNQSWAPIAVSGSLIAAFIPILLVGPIAGTLLDRWPRKRRVMLYMDAFRAVLVAALLLSIKLLSLFGGIRAAFLQLGVLYVVILLLSSCTQFFIQGSNVVYYDIVEDAYRAKAGGMLQTISSIAVIVGPPMATLFFFATGASWAFALNSLSFLISFAFTLAIRLPSGVSESEKKPEQQQSSIFHQWHEGLLFFLENVTLSTILIVGILMYLWGSTFATLGIFFLQRNLHTPASFYGYLGTAEGIGFALGAFLAGLFAHRLGEARTYYWSTLLLGVLVLIFACLTSFVPALIFIFFIGMISVTIEVATYPLVFRITPRNFIGRVTTTLGSIITCMRVISAAIVGWLVSTVLSGFSITLLGLQFGPIAAIFVCNGCLIIIGGLYAMAKLRKMSFKQPEEQRDQV